MFERYILVAISSISQMTTETMKFLITDTKHVVVYIVYGKNVLHPNVGFMWEIIDHMWDDPTFLCGMIPHSLIIILGVEISEERNV